VRARQSASRMAHMRRTRPQVAGIDPRGVRGTGLQEDERLREEGTDPQEVERPPEEGTVQEVVHRWEEGTAQEVAHP